MSAHLDTFRQYLEYEKRYSPHTVHAYLQDTSDFFSFLTSLYEFDDPALVRHHQVRSWMVSLLEAGISPRSVNRKLSTLRTFYRFLLKHGKVEVNPLSRVLPPKTRKTLPSVVDEKSLVRLRDHLTSGSDFTAMRNRLVIELLYGLGLRRAELIGMRLHDIDLKRMEVRVMGKRQKQRIIPFGKELAVLLRDYIALRKEMKDAHPEFLILTDKGKQAYPKLIYLIVHQYLSLVSSVEKRSPHVLRHSYATHMLEAGASIEAIKELLGHESLAATQVYTHTSMERLKKTYKQSHPKA